MAGSADVAAARAFGYAVTVAASGHIRPDTGASVPTVHRIEGHGRSLLLRDDDALAWGALVDPGRHGEWLEQLALSRPVEGADLRSRLIGPIPSAPLGSPGRDYPQFASHVDLAEHGYVEEECFLEGEAARYAVPPLDTARVVSEGHPFRTRIVVRRPIDPAAFNGTFVVEWLNVSAFSNVDILWLETARSLIARGTVYVGVSAQRAGIVAPRTGLRDWSPARYGTLDVGDALGIVDDSLCYDIFTQARLAVAKTLADLGTPARVIAAGASQSHRRLATYYNGVQPAARAFDGFLLSIGRGACELRDDVDAKAIKVNSETDVASAGYVRQPDSDRLRTWEIAGSSHTSHNLSVARRVAEQRGDVPPIPYDLCARPPLSRIPIHQALAAALVRLEEWVAGTREPPHGAPIELEADGTIARDRFGNARGGVRLSQHAVPTAVDTGLNEGPGYLSLCGTHLPFAEALLRELYPTREDYVDAVRRANDENVEHGFVLPEDAAANVAAAEETTSTGSEED